MKYKNIFAALIFMLSILGCDDFGDMNSNPNAPESIDNSPELLLTGLQRDALNQMVTAAWSDGNVMPQYFARIVFTSFDLFEWGSSSGTWNGLFTVARTSYSLYNIGVNNDNTSYQAVSLILKSWAFHILTDMYGDIPYSEALKAKAEGIFSPKYDTQESIYKGILVDLEEANTLLSAANLPLIKGDIIFEGDLLKWRKLANSLRLRALLRLSNIEEQTEIDVEGEITKMLTNPTQYPAIESNEDNGTLIYTTSPPNVHPRSVSVYRIGSLLEWRMSETVEQVLKAYDDPRLMRWFEPTEKSVEAGTPEWAGMKNGLSEGDAYTYKGGASFLSSINLDLYNSPNELEAIIMLSSEVWFIKAEAALRYPGVAKAIDAQTAYETGIERSFEYWKVPIPDDYLARLSSNSEVTVPVAFDGKIETVITQKWLSLFYTDYQAFCEFKRTSFPVFIKPGPDAIYPTYPSRFNYPTEEQALNKENYDVAVARQGPDVNTTPVWWENK